LDAEAVKGFDLIQLFLLILLNNKKITKGRAVSQKTGLFIGKKIAD
jgi:hypothetical protein